MATFWPFTVVLSTGATGVVVPKIGELRIGRVLFDKIGQNRYGGIHPGGLRVSASRPITASEADNSHLNEAVAVRYG